jgi:hypothetical protein
LPANSVARWEHANLIERVLKALVSAREKICSIADGNSNYKKSPVEEDDRALLPKVVAETAMFLLCAEPARCRDQRIGEHIDAIAALLIAEARNDEVRSAICLDPGLARSHAVAHIILGRLGYPDESVDRLLEQSLATDHPHFGPERLPHQLMEEYWIDRIACIVSSRHRQESQLLADSMLGRAMDALGSSRLDIYAFTHSVMYSTDLGTRSIKLPRRRAAIAADAEAALAYSLDSNDFDLTAEVLLTWPMLRLPWSASSAFAFRVLANIEDHLGFLPGLRFDRHRYEALGDERRQYMLSTSYHTMYVMGFVYASSLRPGCAPPAEVPSAGRPTGAARAILELLGSAGSASCWLEGIKALTPAQQDAIAPLMLSVVLRRARTNGDLKQIRTALEVALAFDIARGPAVSQAAGLLRRSQALVT